MKVLGIVPARRDSRRLPRKNRLRLGGRSLVERSLDTATRAAGISHVVLSSNDPDVLSAARERGDCSVLPRPEALSDDRAPAIDYVRHCLENTEAEYDTVCIVQPSSPFTAVEDVDGCIDLMAARGCDSVVTVVQIDHAIHPLKLKRMDGDRLLPLWEVEDGRMAAHELPPVYIRNGSVYLTRTSVIASGRILAEDDCRAIVMPRSRSIDINDEIDFQFAEFLHGRGADGAIE